jgi:hypothetical protein
VIALVAFIAFISLMLVVFWKNIPEYGQISLVPENIDVDYQLVMSLARRWYYTYQQRT